MKQKKNKPVRYIIQVERPKSGRDLESVWSLLRETGVELDSDYGPFLVNKARELYVVRGTASPDAKSKAENLPGIRFFSDAPQSPTTK